MACSCEGKTGLGKWLGTVGSQVGDDVSNRAHKMFKSWTGYGDYDIRYNSLIQGKGEYGASFTNQGRGTIIRHKEFVCDIVLPVTGSVFNSTAIALNPGSDLFFPWVSNIAKNYDQWRPHGMILEFKPVVGDNSSVTTIGSIGIMTDYTADGTAPGDQNAVMAAAYASFGMITDSMIHGVECAPNERSINLFDVSNGMFPIHDSYQNFATAYVCTWGSGIAGSTQIGQLFIHYEVEFFKERITRSPRTWTSHWEMIFTSQKTAMRSQLSSRNGKDANLLVPLSTTTASAQYITQTSMDFGFAAGTDLGIRAAASQNGFMIPRSLHGVPIIAEFWYSNGTADRVMAAPFALGSVNNITRWELTSALGGTGGENNQGWWGSKLLQSFNAGQMVTADKLLHDISGSYATVAVGNKRAILAFRVSAPSTDGYLVNITLPSCTVGDNVRYGVTFTIPSNYGQYWDARNSYS